MLFPVYPIAVGDNNQKAERQKGKAKFPFPDSTKFVQS